MRRKNPKHILPSMTKRICTVVFVLWLVCMYAITSVAAESLFMNFAYLADAIPEQAWLLGRFSERLDGNEEQPPGYETYTVWQAVRNFGFGLSHWSISESGHRPLLNSDAVAVDTAAAVFDADGNIVAYPSSFFDFTYCYNETDLQTAPQPDGYAVCVLDRQMDTADAKLWLEQNLRSTSWSEVSCYRLTGVLVDGYLTLQKAEYLPNPAYTLEDAVWKELAAVPNAAPESSETVTLYTDRYTAIWASTYTPSRSFNYQGTKMSDLSDYLSQIGSDIEYGDGRQLKFTNFVHSGIRFYFDSAELDSAIAEEREPPLEYKLVTVMLASPWRSAISALRNVYIVTFLIMGFGILWLRKRLKWDIAEPVITVNQAIAQGWTNIYIPADQPEKYTETRELLEHYHNTHRTLSQNKDAIIRLERALNFAQKAEANRRQMTSNIAHELKTPLAVIHSYAEGLSERIAEDKRDKYLGIILSETERMDGMVLEMLDLSRLEAGKVKLAREDFSLSELAASVFDRLELAIAAKELLLTLELDEDCVINADPARIEQVITNFAINAVKYTPFGGSIRAHTIKSREKVTFSMENDSPPLSDEALSKIWETFYSAEASRTASGTGLGLAIAKSIIELHSGTCQAQNTKTGLKFTFKLDS